MTTPSKSKDTMRSQASFKANVTRKKTANQRRYEAGEISLSSLRSLNAAVTRAARQSGMSA